MKLYSKQELIDAIKDIFQEGWHKSIKKTRDTRNDGAVGNTIENLLGIKENNLPIPNTQEWELKGQRANSTSLVTLKHIEPSPKAAKIVSNILLPLYGWKHQSAGIKYPITEMSFRSTTSATEYTSRGFKILVDRHEQKIKFIFNASKAMISEPEIASWLKSVKDRIGLGPINPEPYWGIEDLKYAIGEKIKNSFYVVADSDMKNGHEYFLYKELYVLSGFSPENFIKCIENDIVLIDFDARTGHNHGTKFRIRQGHWKDLFSEVKRAI